MHDMTPVITSSSDVNQAAVILLCESCSAKQIEQLSCQLFNVPFYIPNLMIQKEI